MHFNFEVRQIYFYLFYRHHFFIATHHLLLFHLLQILSLLPSFVRKYNFLENLYLLLLISHQMYHVHLGLAYLILRFLLSIHLGCYILLICRYFCCLIVWCAYQILKLLILSLFLLKSLNHFLLLLNMGGVAASK